MFVLSNNGFEKMVFLKKEKRLSDIQDTFESRFELGVEVAYSVLAESKNLDEATKKILVIISRIKEKKRSKVFDFYGI
ncbi:MAG: hypothetical protein ABGF52_02985 [Candidatus Asgardarchaeum sp.]